MHTNVWINPQELVAFAPSFFGPQGSQKKEKYKVRVSLAKHTHNYHHTTITATATTTTKISKKKITFKR